MDHIAIFLPSLEGGGAERVMVTLANAFVGRGYSADLVLARCAGPYLENVAPEVRLVNLGSGRVLRSLPLLTRYLRRERPTALLSAMDHANMVAIAARVLSRRNLRLVVSVRNMTSIEARNYRKGFYERIMYWLAPYLYPKADEIIAVSHGVARDLERFARLPAASVLTIYNPFDLQHIARMAREPVDHPWLTPDQPPLVLAIGRLTEQKDFPTLLRAFALAQQSRPLHLLILGEGEQRGELEALAHELGLTTDAVQMPGFVRNPYAYLARCAVFVLSSRYEGLPGVLVEALACGAPVVSTDCDSGPREILEGGRWGVLTPVGDPGALARAILEVLATPRERLPNVRLRAQDFDLSRAVDAYLAALGLPPYVLDYSQTISRGVL